MVRLRLSAGPVSPSSTARKRLGRGACCGPDSWAFSWLGVVGGQTGFLWEDFCTMVACCFLLHVNHGSHFEFSFCPHYSVYSPRYRCFCVLSVVIHWHFLIINISAIDEAWKTTKTNPRPWKLFLLVSQSTYVIFLLSLFPPGTPPPFLPGTFETRPFCQSFA